MEYVDLVSDLYSSIPGFKTSRSVFPISNKIPPKNSRLEIPTLIAAAHAIVAVNPTPRAVPIVPATKPNPAIPADTSGNLVAKDIKLVLTNFELSFIKIEDASKAEPKPLLALPNKLIE